MHMLCTITIFSPPGYFLIFLLVTVTEVVWEGEEQDTKSNNNSSAKIAGSNTVSNATNRYGCSLACSFYHVFYFFNHFIRYLLKLSITRGVIHTSYHSDSAARH